MRVRLFFLGRIYHFLKKNKKENLRLYYHYLWFYLFSDWILGFWSLAEMASQFQYLPLPSPFTTSSHPSPPPMLTWRRRPICYSRKLDGRCSTAALSSRLISTGRKLGSFRCSAGMNFLFVAFLPFKGSINWLCFR